MIHRMIIFLIYYQLQNSPFDEKEIYGAWRWLYSTGGFLENTVTPENTHASKKILFTKDHVILYYAGDSVIVKQNYNIQDEKTIFSVSRRPVLRLSGLSKVQEISLAGKDTLKLKDNTYDGYEHVYVRLPD